MSGESHDVLKIGPQVIKSLPFTCRDCGKPLIVTVWAKSNTYDLTHYYDYYLAFSLTISPGDNHRECADLQRRIEEVRAIFDASVLTSIEILQEKATT